MSLLVAQDCEGLCFDKLQIMLQKLQIKHTDILDWTHWAKNSIWMSIFIDGCIYFFISVLIFQIYEMK